MCGRVVSTVCEVLGSNENSGYLFWPLDRGLGEIPGD